MRRSISLDKEGADAVANKLRRSNSLDKNRLDAVYEKSEKRSTRKARRPSQFQAHEVEKLLPSNTAGENKTTNGTNSHDHELKPEQRSFCLRPDSRIVAVLLLAVLVFAHEFRGVLHPFRRDEHSLYSQSIVAKEAKEVDQPELIIHVGPPKTATTFLQCTMCQNLLVAGHGGILEQDNLMFIGACPYMCGDIDKIRKGPVLTLDHTTIYQNGSPFDDSEFMGPLPEGNRIMKPEDFPYSKLPPFSPKFLDRVKQGAQEKKNILLIFEGAHKMNNLHIYTLRKFTDGLGYKLRIMVAYRPFYEWLPSKYNQLEKPVQLTMGKRHGGPIQVWPHQRNRNPKDSKPLLPFDLNRRGRFGEWLRGVEKGQEHIVETVVRRFAQFVDRIDILPMFALSPTANSTLIPPSHIATLEQLKESDVNPYIHNMFCSALEYTTATCKAIESGFWKGATEDNPSFSFDGDIIAIEAYNQGLLKREIVGKAMYLPRDEVLQRVMAKLDNDKTPLPQNCMKKSSLDRLLNLSLTAEEKLFFGDSNAPSTPIISLPHLRFPSNNTHSDIRVSVPLLLDQEHLAKNRQEHTEKFYKGKKKRYCWVDAKAVLETPEWKSFFQTLSLGVAS